MVTHVHYWPNIYSFFLTSRYHAPALPKRRRQRTVFDNTKEALGLDRFLTKMFIYWLGGRWVAQGATLGSKVCKPLCFQSRREKQGRGVPPFIWGTDRGHT